MTTGLQKLFSRAGSDPTSIEGVTEEIQATQLGRDFGSRQVARWVQDFAQTKPFELWQNMDHWQEALDNGKSLDPRMDQIKIKIVLRLWESQPFRLPTLFNMPRKSKNARREFLEFSIVMMEDELAYGHNTELLAQLELFRATLNSNDF